MYDLESLFSFALQHERTIVFGNVGRYVTILYDALNKMDHLQITVTSSYYPFPNTNHQIRVVACDENMESCDVHIIVEPHSLKYIQKHPNANRVIVFTSHLTFQTYKHDYWVYVSYFHDYSEDSITRIKQLLKLQDFPIQTKNINYVKVENPNVFVVKGHSITTPTEPDTYFILDLTEFTKSTLGMYLAFWDAFDFLLQHLHRVQRWVICFAEPNGRRTFEQFTQKCIDRLYCQRFEHGNVTEKQSIFNLLPYFTRGIMDDHFDVKQTSFGGMRIVIPKTYQDACKAAVKYHLKPIAKNVFQILTQ